MTIIQGNFFPPCCDVGTELGWPKKDTCANLANYQDPDHHHSPLHIDPQENISEEKEGDDQ